MTETEAQTESDHRHEATGTSLLDNQLIIQLHVTACVQRMVDLWGE